MQGIKCVFLSPDTDPAKWIFYVKQQYLSAAEMALAGNMTLSKEEEEYINIITKYLVPVMFSLVILIGSIGNILVIYVVRLKHSSRIWYFKNIYNFICLI